MTYLAVVGVSEISIITVMNLMHVVASCNSRPDWLVRIYMWLLQNKLVANEYV